MMMGLRRLLGRGGNFLFSFRSICFFMSIATNCLNIDTLHVWVLVHDWCFDGYTWISTYNVNRRETPKQIFNNPTKKQLEK